MSSLDHLRGVLSASWDGCFLCARLQLHHRTVEIRTGFCTILGRRPWMSPDSSKLVSLLEGHKQVMSLVIFELHWRQCSEAPVVLRYTFMIDAAYSYHRDSNSQLASPHSYVPDPVDSQSWRYSIPWECHGSNVPNQHCIQPHIEATIIISLVLYDRLLPFRA